MADENLNRGFSTIVLVSFTFLGQCVAEA